MSKIAATTILIGAFILLALLAGCASKNSVSPHPVYAGVVRATNDVGRSLDAASADGKTVLDRHAAASEIVAFLETQTAKLLAQ